jgi:hypothetical protein
MRRFLLSVGILLSVTSLGCSLFNGKEGFLDRAAAKDTSDSLMIHRCSEHTYNQYCVPDTSAPDCRKFCG